MFCLPFNKKKRGGVRKYDDKEKKNCYKQCNTFTLMNNVYDEGQSFFYFICKRMFIIQIYSTKQKKKSEMKNTPNRGSAYISLTINILYQETKETP